jgi:hypothetical protein
VNAANHQKRRDGTNHLENEDIVYSLLVSTHTRILPPHPFLMLTDAKVGGSDHNQKCENKHNVLNNM